MPILVCAKLQGCVTDAVTDVAQLVVGMGDGSLGYAERLSFRAELGGTLGEPEIADASADVAAKVAKLAKMISDSHHLVVFTGACISTACGIPGVRACEMRADAKRSARSRLNATRASGSADFRGPNGVWTKQRRGEALPKASIPFEHARPSITHQALLALQRSGKLKYLVSQNVDSLHLRSGFPREQLAELHGNCFAERCDACGKEYVRDFELCSVGFKSTGRRCTACKGALRDHCLDWDNALPEDEVCAPRSRLYGPPREGASLTQERVARLARRSCNWPNRTRQRPTWCSAWARASSSRPRATSRCSRCASASTSRGAAALPSSTCRQRSTTSARLSWCVHVANTNAGCPPCSLSVAPNRPSPRASSRQVHSRVDEVMAAVMSAMSCPPPFSIERNATREKGIRRK